MEFLRKLARHKYLNKIILVKNWNIHKDNSANKHSFIFIDKCSLSAIFIKQKSKRNRE